jgi:hypothetical protein
MYIDLISVYIDLISDCITTTESIQSPTSGDKNYSGNKTDSGSFYQMHSPCQQLSKEPIKTENWQEI